MKEIELKDKVMLVTGASRGLGRDICLHFAGQGLKIAATARTEEKLAELKKEVEKKGGDIVTFVLDITDYEGMEKVAGDIINKWGRIDILVNNAGVGYGAPLEDITKDEIDATIDTNLKGLIYATKIVSPLIKDTGGGHIINISSFAGVIPRGNNGIYPASKSGVNAFSEAMSGYLLKDDIKVTAICPGGIETSWWEREKNPNLDEGLLETSEIISIIESIILSNKNTLYRTVILRPVSEAKNPIIV